MAAAPIWAIVCFVALAIEVQQLVTWVQPDARVPVTMDTAFDLATNTGHNFYGGEPYVRDGTPITVSQVSTTVSNVPLLTRTFLGTAPVVWALTGLAVAVLVVLALGRLAAGSPFGRDAARPVVRAAVVLAIGSTLAQVVQDVVYAGFGTFGWAAPGAASHTISRGGSLSFLDFAPLLAACGLLVVALVLRRGLALQRDVDGLV